jgi:hypothetical protein
VTILGRNASMNKSPRNVVSTNAAPDADTVV